MEKKDQELLGQTLFQEVAQLLPEPFELWCRTEGVRWCGVCVSVCGGC